MQHISWDHFVDNFTKPIVKDNFLSITERKCLHGIDWARFRLLNRMG